MSHAALQVFMERKIIGRVFGAEAEAFDAHRGRAALQEAVDSLGPGHLFTQLVPSLEGGLDPDDAFSRVPYEKGFYFLYRIQTLAGGPSKFEPFMRAYIDAFALKTVTTDEFKAFLLDYFADVEALHTLDWDAWLYAPGALACSCAHAL
jgi:leukotriene-A4 hydrolase